MLCEKPFAVYAGRGAPADRASPTSASVIVTMASKFRYVDDVADAQATSSTRASLGEPILFENVFASRVPMAGRWNADPAVSPAAAC